MCTYYAYIFTAARRTAFRSNWRIKFGMKLFWRESESVFKKTHCSLQYWKGPTNIYAMYLRKKLKCLPTYSLLASLLSFFLVCVCLFLCVLVCLQGCWCWCGFFFIYDNFALLEILPTKKFCVCFVIYSCVYMYFWFSPFFFSNYIFVYLLYFGKLFFCLEVCALFGMGMYVCMCLTTSLF